MSDRKVAAAWAEVGRAGLLGHPAVRDLIDRIRECLRFAAAGWPVRNAADALGITPDTVRAHRKKARVRLGCRTLSQTVAEAIRTGVID